MQTIRNVRHICLAMAMALGAATSVSAAETTQVRQPDFRRGWQLHDDTCTGCHGASMYSRPYHERNPYFTVRKQVEIWQEFVGMGWTQEQIADVAYYVQKRFYEKVCEPGSC
jgi:mono/diheme cytochrome c family protein